MNFQSFVQQHGKEQVVQKRSHVFRQGDLDQHIYVVQSGLLKAYYVSAEGKESIKSFILPGDVIGSLTANVGMTFCSFGLLALQQASLLQIPFTQLLQTAWQQPDVANQLIQMLLNLSMKKEQREYELLCLPAERRYLQLKTKLPGLFQQVSQNDIALYLGITPVALSRIKKRLDSVGTA